MYNNACKFNVHVHIVNSHQDNQEHTHTHTHSIVSMVRRPIVIAYNERHNLGRHLSVVWQPRAWLPVVVVAQWQSAGQLKPEAMGSTLGGTSFLLSPLPF